MQECFAALAETPSSGNHSFARLSDTETGAVAKGTFHNNQAKLAT